MAKVTKEPVVNPEYKYVLELTQDEVERLYAILGSMSVGTLQGVFDPLWAMDIPRTYKMTMLHDVPCLERIAR